MNQQNENLQLEKQKLRNQNLKELFNESGSFADMAEKAKNRLIERGYIYNPVFGWEKPETITSFQLDP